MAMKVFTVYIIFKKFVGLKNCIYLRNFLKICLLSTVVFLFLNNLTNFQFLYRNVFIAFLHKMLNFTYKSYLASLPINLGHYRHHYCFHLVHSDLLQSFLDTGLLHSLFSWKHCIFLSLCVSSYKCSTRNKLLVCS